MIPLSPSNTRLTAGCIVMAGASAFCILERIGARCRLLRIVPCGGPRHRADIEPLSWTDLALSGLDAASATAIRCVPIEWQAGPSLVELGRVSDALLERLRSAVLRERDARRFEESGPVASNLFAHLSNGHRRTPARRGA